MIVALLHAKLQLNVSFRNMSNCRYYVWLSGHYVTCAVVAGLLHIIF